MAPLQFKQSHFCDINCNANVQQQLNNLKLRIIIARHRHRGRCRRHRHSGISIRYLSILVPDWVPLLHYRTGSGIKIFIQSGTGLCGCIIVLGNAASTLNWGYRYCLMRTEVGKLHGRQIFFCYFKWTPSREKNKTVSSFFKNI